MKSLKNISFSELKSIYDFLEIRKKIVSDNSKSFEEGEIHVIINKQKLVWLELHNRLNGIIEFQG